MSTPSPTEFYETLFADTRQAGVYHLPRSNLSALEAGAGAAGCCVFHVDLARARSKSDILDAVGKALAFPEWFGANWDALNDCLLDMGWRPAVGYVVILDHCDGIHAHAEADFVTLVQIFQSVADQRREDDVPFWCLVDMLADGIAWLPSFNQPT